ncbi:MAG: DnaJ domain-containing protein [Desulfatitalea sp.]|nr:J domain-containing protein [Desulfatitalea sp.]NNK01297.1 DnaJ domain-containing protein [Desulfatitalea sp.]
MNPYDRLGVDTNADDATIRRAYLGGVKRFPPERFPEQFSAVNEAYQLIKDADSRRRYLLFSKQAGERSPIEAVRSHFKGRQERTPLPFEAMKTFLRGCMTR